MTKIIENNENVVIFDTSFLIENKNNLNKIVERINEKYVCYIPQICIDEYIAKTYLTYKDKIELFKKDVPNYTELGIHFDNTDSQNKNIIKLRCDNFFKKIFNNNIICFHEYSLGKIISRAYDKKPPFGKSDTGFKDTLILLNIIDYIKGRKKQKITFITNDSDFIKNSNDIKNEIMKKTNCAFNIVDGKGSLGKLYSYLKIDDEPEEINNYIESEEEVIKINNARTKLNKICNNIFCYEEFDDDVFDTISKNTFITNEKLELSDIKVFIDKIPEVLNNNLFSQKLKMSNFFGNDSIFLDQISINVEYFEQLIEIFNLIKSNTHYKKSFYNYILKRFDDCYNPFAGLDISF